MEEENIKLFEDLFKGDHSKANMNERKSIMIMQSNLLKDKQEADLKPDLINKIKPKGTFGVTLNINSSKYSLRLRYHVAI